MNQIANIASAIVTVALVATLVQSRNTANIITAVGRSFAGSIQAARGT